MRARARRLWRDCAGVAVVEFAIALPLLFALYLFAYVLSDMISAKRKVTVAARELTDVTSRYVALSQSDAATIMAAIAQEMYPYDTSKTQVRISEIELCPGGTSGKVVWSLANANASALVVGSSVTLPSGLFSSTSPMVPATSCGAGGYLVYGEVAYPYTPVIGYGPVSTITFSDNALLLPRAATSIGLI